MTAPSSFGERVRGALETFGPLCVGIDPHRALLEGWGLEDSAAGAREFGLRVVEASVGAVGIVKPQVSFFERHGSAGFAALEEVLAAARAAGLLVIADAKRGDIGSTMDAYAEAWLRPGSPLEADAMTASPFLGVGALKSTFALAEASGKGVFVLAATSNPEASAAQGAVLGGRRTLSAAIIAEVSGRNALVTPESEWASTGFVIGATVDWDRAGLAAFAPPAPILAPGFGHQGAGPGDLPLRFGELAPCVIASESRSILEAGPTRLGAVIKARVTEYRGIRA